MAKFELYEYGIENTCDEIEKILKSVLGKSYSKQVKDIAISKAMGMVKTLNMIVIPKEEVDCNDRGE